MANIIFWLLAVGNGIWTLQWIFSRHNGIGHKTMFVPILLLWLVFFYLFKRPELSRYHILWIVPVVIVAELLVSFVVLRIFRRVSRKKDLEKLNRRKNEL